MSSADWDDYVSIIYGTGDPRATTLKEEVLATPGGTPYLVYDTYDWVPSETRELPEDDFDPGPGEWVLTDDDGNVIERFADFDERADALRERPALPPRGPGGAARSRKPAQRAGSPRGVELGRRGHVILHDAQCLVGIPLLDGVDDGRVPVVGHDAG
jgi:hypothetical protein